jgi:hypothetical protein
MCVRRVIHVITEFFKKKGLKKIKIRKRGASWKIFKKWVPPAR